MSSLRLRRHVCGICAQLVQYDASQKRNPFTLVDVDSIAPMKCDPAALECWRRECDTPLFARYRPPASPPTPTAVEVPSEFEVTYEALLERFLGEADLHKGGKPQYASAVWTHTPEQAAAVNAALPAVAGEASRPVTLKVARAGEWTDAEEYHQHYIKKMQAKRGW